MSRSRIAVGFVFAALSGSAFAQSRNVEVTPFIGYQAGGSASSFDGSLSILADVDFGVAVDVRVSPETTFQLLYNRQETNVDIKINDAFAPTFLSEPVAVDYYHFGGTVEFPYEGIRPYFAMTVGASRFDLEREGFRDEWRFSMGFGGGFKTYFSDRVGIRIDGRVLPTFINTNGGFFCSLPGGCLVRIDSQFIAQVNASFGIFLAF